MTFGKATEKLYFFALSGVAFFLPLSEWLLSFFTILLVIIWFARQGYKRLPSLLSENKAVGYALIIYLVPVVWMINTSDYQHGFHDLLIKLPLIAFPLVIGLNEPITKREFRGVFTLFIGAVLTASIIAVYKLWGTPFSDWTEKRDSVLFISHIRLSLMTNLALFSCLFFLFIEKGVEKPLKYFYAVAIFPLIYFIIFLSSLSGILIFGILSMGSIIYIAIITRNRLIRFALLSGACILIINLIFLIIININSFYRIVEPIPSTADQYTVNGNSYSNFPERKDIENGRYVWMYVCEEEMNREWRNRSLIDYTARDMKNQELRYTLIRYLTSVGLRKDSLGVASLSENDIKNIENGIANKRFTERRNIESMLYGIIWQIDYYRRGGNPSGHSVTQRIEYFKTGLRIVKRNLLLGTGTGDVPLEFRKQYKTDQTILDPGFRDRTHNQYLTLLISFGVVGFVLIFFSIWKSVKIRDGIRNPLFVIFLVIVLVSMVSEDTLETHAGVSFFAYFYSLLLFVRLKC
jgi:hypothetical protein